MLTCDERGLRDCAGPWMAPHYDLAAEASRPDQLDHCFTDLERGGDGLACVGAHDPETGVTSPLWVDERYPYLMLFTGDTVPDVNRRSLAVEPMTCPPKAFCTGEAVVRLEPGESTSGAWGIAASG